MTESPDRKSLQIPIYRDARKDGPLIYHTENLGLLVQLPNTDFAGDLEMCAA